MCHVVIVIVSLTLVVLLSYHRTVVRVFFVFL